MGGGGNGLGAMRIGVCGDSTAKGLATMCSNIMNGWDSNGLGLCGWGCGDSTAKGLTTHFINGWEWQRPGAMRMGGGVW